jgi:hypothetical protein
VVVAVALMEELRKELFRWKQELAQTKMTRSLTTMKIGRVRRREKDAAEQVLRPVRTD